MKRVLKKKITASVEKTKTGFSAYALDFPVYTTGKNIAELSSNLTEAMNLFFEENNYVITENNIQIKVAMIRNPRN